MSEIVGKFPRKPKEYFVRTAAGSGRGGKVNRNRINALQGSFKIQKEESK